MSLPNENQTEHTVDKQAGLTFPPGPACPDCGSKRTTLYDVSPDGDRTLYCDDCKREEPHTGR